MIKKQTKPNTSKDTGPHPDPNKIGTGNKPKWRTKKRKSNIKNIISGLEESKENSIKK